MSRAVRPDELVQPLRHLCGEVLQAVDDEAEVALAFRGVDGRFMALVELRQALLHARNPRLKFGFLDKPLGATVDEAIDAAPQGCHLLILLGAFGLCVTIGKYVAFVRRLHSERFQPLAAMAILPVNKLAFAIAIALLMIAAIAVVTVLFSVS